MVVNLQDHQEGGHSPQHNARRLAFKTTGSSLEQFSDSFGHIPDISGTTVAFHSVGAALARQLLDVLNAYDYITGCPENKQINVKIFHFFSMVLSSLEIRGERRRREAAAGTGTQK